MFEDYDFNSFGVAGNPFSGLPTMQGYAMGMPTVNWAPPEVQPPPVQPSTEGMVGANVNPLAAGSPDKTNDPSKAVAATDTDVGAAAVKKSKSMADVLKGLKAPAPPTPQTIRSPAAPQMAPQKGQLSVLLASMGVTPQQMLRLSQTFGR